MSDSSLPNESRKRIEALDWYHTIELAPDLVTDGWFDLRPDLRLYRLPEDLSGKTVLDVGAASGFFAFEFERRGAQVTAMDLPGWEDHDHGPRYWILDEEKERAADVGGEFELAREILGSKVEKKELNVYELTPETMGMFDIVFCGSMLLHLTDPLRAIWNIASVAREKAIIATSVKEDFPHIPCAFFQGHFKGDAWWAPTRSCLELWCATAQFEGVEYVGEYRPLHRGERLGPLQGIIHCYKTAEGWTPKTRSSQSLIDHHNPKPLYEPKQKPRPVTPKLLSKIKSRFHRRED